MSDDSFKIECPYCTQHIRAYPEHIGYDINCPTCGEEYTIPSPSEDDDTSANDYAGDIAGHPFLTEEDFKAVAEENQESIDFISGLNPDLWWECMAMGELLSNRVDVLRESVAVEHEEHFHPGTRDELIAFYNLLEQRTVEFIDIMNFLSRALTSDLQRAVVRPGLKTIVHAANKVEREVLRMRDFHDMLFEHSLPQQEPFPELQRVLAGWGPYIATQLDLCVEQLYEKGNGPTGEWGDARLTVSLIPPDLTYFLKLKKQLQTNVGH